MTISNQTVTESYVGNGIITTFAITQSIADNEEIVVVHRDVDGVETVLVATVGFDYVGTPATAVDLAVAPAVGETVTLTRANAIVQQADYIANGPFPAESHEATLDNIVKIIQEVNEKLRRIPQFKVTSEAEYDLELPDMIDESIFSIDVDGNFEWILKSEFTGATGPEGPAGPVGPTGVTGPTGFGTVVLTPLAPAGTTQVVDWNNANIQVIDLAGASGDVTLTLSNPSADPARYTLIFLQGAIPRQVVWPATVKFPQGQEPLISLTNGAIDKVELIWETNTYYGDWNNDYLTT